MADILFEDIFEVKDIDSGGKKFLRGRFSFNNNGIDGSEELSLF